MSVYIWSFLLISRPQKFKFCNFNTRSSPDGGERMAINISPPPIKFKSGNSPHQKKMRTYEILKISLLPL